MVRSQKTGVKRRTSGVRKKTENRRSGRARRRARSAARSWAHVVVTGDLVLDHNLILDPAAPAAHQQPFARQLKDVMQGGAWFLGDLITRVCEDLATVSIIGPSAAGSAPQVPTAYSVWELHDRVVGSDDDRVWRIKSFLGCERGREVAVDPSSLGFEKAGKKVLVVDDIALGFARSDLSRVAHTLSEADEIILKTSAPLDDNPLLDDLIQDYSRKLTVIASVDALRARGAAISQGLSWDRTIEETATEFTHGGRAYDDLARCKRVVIYFANAGAASFTREPLRTGKSAEAARRPARARFERFVYLPSELEGVWEDARPGKTFGSSSILTAAMVRYSVAPDYPLFMALTRGLQASRLHHDSGAGGLRSYDAFFSRDDVVRILTSSPSEEEPETGHATFFSAYPHEVLTDRKARAQPATVSDLLGDLTGPGIEHVTAKGFDVVWRGVDAALAPAPKAQYGKFFTVDREEIERINAVRRLIVSYRADPGDKRPLSVAIFGPPGCGKSFAVKELASELFGDDARPLEFNLSQFDLRTPAELHQAFHQVRDETVRGRIPLVLWDEFDAEGFQWLRHFLAPMQDSEFRAGSIVHPFGKAIFVFAGGTCENYSQFREGGSAESEAEAKTRRTAFKMVKGTDFVSRLRGYIDIKGPNPSGPRDGDTSAYVIRRALQLRSFIERECKNLIDPNTKRARVSARVLRAFLQVEEFTYGARSLEAIIRMSDLRGASTLDVAHLPTMEMLGQHVDAEEFAAQLAVDALEYGEIDVLAAWIHNAWGEEASDRDSRRDDPRIGAYAGLSEEDKEANLAAARVAKAKLLDVGYEMRRGLPGKASAAKIPEPKMTRLSEIEHDRWVREHMLKGFEYGDRNKKIGRHPNIVPFSELTRKDKNYDRKIMRRIVEVLREWGFEIAPGKQGRSRSNVAKKG